MVLDMGHVHRLRDAGLLIEIAHIAGQICIIVNAPDIAFEMPDIDGIETALML